MKKFTKIEEDLITEKLEVQEKFVQQYKLAEEQIEQIKKNLYQFSVEYYGDPAGRAKDPSDRLNVKDDYMYVESLEKLNDSLEDIIKYDL